MIRLYDVDIQGEHMRLDSLTLHPTGAACFALLGLPHAGKTTLVKALAGLIRPVAGEGYVLEYRLGDPRIMRDSRIGWLHQATNWPGNLTVDEVIHMAMLRHPDSPYLDDIDSLIALAGLQACRTRPASQLSPDERQRAGLIALHLRDLQLLILDDPAAGALPDERHVMLDLIAHTSSGRTVFFTTSHLADVQRIADHAAVLYQGQVIAQGSVDDLFTLPDTVVFRVVLHGDTQIVYQQLHTLAWVQHLVEHGHGNQREWIIWLRDEGDTTSHLLRAILADRRLKVIEFNQIRPRLDDFLHELERATPAS